MKRWKILAALTFARTSMGFQFQSVASVSPFISADLGLEKAQIGWLIGLYLLPGIAVALPGGLLGARFGDKRVVVVGLALMAIGGAWLALSQSYQEANAARFLSGVGAVTLNVLLTKMVADWFDGRERLLAMSILINSWPLGIGLALLALGVLAEQAGWQWAIGISALFAAAGLASVLALYRSPGGGTAATGIGVRALTRHEWMLLGIAALPWLLYNAAYQVLVSFLPSYFLQTGMSVARAGALSALNTVFFVIAVQAGGVILKRATNPDVVCQLAILGWCATLLALSTGWMPLVWVVLGGLLGGLPASAYVNLPTEFLQPAHRGAGMGVFFTIYYLGCAVLPAVAGSFYDLSGDARTTLWTTAALALACVPILAWFRRRLTLLATPAT